MFKHYVAVDWAIANMAVARMTEKSDEIKVIDVPSSSESSSWDVFKENYTIFNSKYTFYGEC
ncbi:MAG: hypothetical protein WCJ72_13490 [Chryseobacterium sp.]